MAAQKNVPSQNLKNELLKALDKEEWRRSSDVKPKISNGINPQYLGRALRGLVRLGLADALTWQDRTWYRLGTGEMLKASSNPVAAHASKKKEAWSPELEVPKELPLVYTAGSASTFPKPSTPSVIPAGRDYLVFASLVKIRVVGPERVQVFYDVVGDDYNLSCDEYDGEAARNIIEAFEQRLHGWISTKMVEDLRAQIKRVEAEKNRIISQLTDQNNALGLELAKVRGKLAKFQKTLEED